MKTAQKICFLRESKELTYQTVYSCYKWNKRYVPTDYIWVTKRRVRAPAPHLFSLLIRKPDTTAKYMYEATVCKPDIPSILFIYTCCILQLTKSIRQSYTICTDMQCSA